MTIPRRRTQGAGQIGDCGGRHRPDQRHVHSGCGESRLERGFEHVARNPRVLADDDLARASHPASAVPAAHPSFRKKSVVIGGVPTSPRIPSVPKYFRIWTVNSPSCHRDPGRGTRPDPERCSTPTAAPGRPEKSSDRRSVRSRAVVENKACDGCYRTVRQ